MDEMRCERKINMVLKDINVDTYIGIDISDKDLYDEVAVSQLDNQV